MIDIIKPRMEKTGKKKIAIQNVASKLTNTFDFKKKIDNILKKTPKCATVGPKKLEKENRSRLILELSNSESEEDEQSVVSVNSVPVPLECSEPIAETKQINAKLKKKLNFERKQKAINRKEVQKHLVLENQFITDVMKMMPLQRNDNDEGEDDDDDVYLGNKKTVKKEEDTEKQPLPGSQAGLKRAQSLAELHERLQSKLAEYKGKSQSFYGIKKEKKQIKKKLSKIEKKKKKKEKRMKDNQLKTAFVHTITKQKENTTDAPAPKPKKPIFNADGHMVYSKFDFSETGSEEKGVKKQDPKRVLQSLQKDKEKIDELVSSGELGKASVIIEKKSWKNALLKVEGVKVRDNPQLVKKSVKRVEHLKKHSSKKWETRIESVQKKRDDKQKKRKGNIIKRKKEKKDKKMKKLIKKGRVFPGVK